MKDLKLGDILEAGSSFKGSRTFWLLESISAKNVAKLTRLRWCDPIEPMCLKRTPNWINRKIYPDAGIWLSPTSSFSVTGTNVKLSNKEPKTK